MSSSAIISQEAVLFIDQEKVVKEMLYPEFEAVLDGVVGLADCADPQITAVFGQLNVNVQVLGMAFFLLDVQADGQIKEDWNIPLRHLLDNAITGPDMGAGAVRLVSHSSCPVAWYKDSLWDPCLDEPNNSFNLVADALKRNRLGIVAGEQSDAETAAKEEMQAKYRERLQTVTLELKLKQSTAQARYRERIGDLESRYKDQLVSKEAALQSVKRMYAAERKRSQQLKARLQQAARRLVETRQEFESSLQTGDSEFLEQLEALQKQFQGELDTALQEQADELEERIEMREAELHYRDEQLATTREALAQLREEYKQLQNTGGDQMLQQMLEADISFVAYHPGVEHLPITMSEMNAYLENKNAFIAEKCGISEEVYQQWLTHYRLPVCRAVNENSQYCGREITKVMKPIDFTIGVSDRCGEHGGAAVSED